MSKTSAAARIELAIRDVIAHPSDYAPLGIVVISVLFLVVGAVWYGYGPVSSGYAHIVWNR